LIEITAVVGGGAGGVFGALPVFAFVEPPAEDVGPADEELGALVFCTDWTKGSLLAKFANSVSWPGSAFGCTNARIDCAGVGVGAAAAAGGPPLTGACVVLAGFGAAGADADVSTTGAFADGLMSFIVFGTSYTRMIASTAVKMMARRFCFFDFD
jgi:hypothetical protein